MEGTAPGTNPAPQVEAPPISLDALIDAKFGTPELSASEPHTGVDFAAVIDALPPDARKLVANLRADYTRKTSEISARKKELEQRESALLSPTTSEALAALAKVPEGLDLYSPDGLEQYIAAKTAEQLQKALEPAREQQQLAVRKQQLESFAAQHTDFDTHKPAIVELIKAGTVSNAEDGYWLIRGRLSANQAATQAAELEAYKVAARAAGMKVSTGSSTQNSKPEFRTALEALAWHEQNDPKFK